MNKFEKILIIVSFTIAILIAFFTILLIFTPLKEIIFKKSIPIAEETKETKPEKTTSEITGEETEQTIEETTPKETVEESEAVLTVLPCDSSVVRWMQPFGNVDHGSGNAFFHNGIDFGTTANGRFFSCADGTVTQIEMNTGAGWPGTNYRIIIQVATGVYLDYHFEIAGSVPEAQRKNNIFVAVGDWVTAGQHIGNLIVLDPDIAHVHWGVLEGDSVSKCPLDYFTANVAQNFEALYDSGIEKRPSSRADLCE